MRLILVFLTIAFFGFAPSLQAQTKPSPVVVELYTSQGCSSCPPADKILAGLAKRDDVIALALHVDYWDYLGWKDSFASSTFSKRQRAYAAADGKHAVYTPQMIVQGRSYAIGNQMAEVKRSIAMHENDAPVVNLSLKREGDQLVISVSCVGDKVGRAVVQIVRYMPKKVVQITAGENAGRRLEYSNIVTQWSPVVKWNGRDDLVTRTTIKGNDAVVVLVQLEGFGPILAAQKLR